MLVFSTSLEPNTTQQLTLQTARLKMMFLQTGLEFLQAKFSRSFQLFITQFVTSL